MSSATIDLSSLFAPGTAVGAYARSQWPQSSGPPAGGPQGAAVDTQNVGANGKVTFVNLADDGTRYRVYSGGVIGPEFMARDTDPEVRTDALLATSFGMSGALADNTDAFNAACAAAQAQGKPLLLDLLGTVRFSKTGVAAVNACAAKIKAREAAGGGPLTILGPGPGLLTFQMSAAIPRLFDCDALGVQNQTFSDHDVSGFDVDFNNVAYTDLAPATAVTSAVTIAGGFAWTRVSLTSNAAFRNQDVVWALPSNTGTANSQIFGVRIPANDNGTDVEVQSATSYTLAVGDQLSGAFTSDHALYGNRHGTKLQTTSGGTQLTQFYKNIKLHNIELNNLPALQTSGGLNAPSPSRRFGVAIQVTGVGSKIENVTYDRVRINGGDCGTWTVGAAGTWIDNITHEDCFHDRGSVATANYSSLNFMVGSQAWGGRAYFRGHNHGLNSGDVGIEVDNMMIVDISRETLIEDAYSANYYGTNFVPPARSIAGPTTATVGAGGIDNASTTLPITAIPSGVDQEGYLLVGTEIMHYDNTSTTSTKVRRGINGSAAAAHNAGDTITFLETRRQRWNFEGRSRRINCASGSGVKMLTNSFLPLPSLNVRGSHERVNDTAVQGEAIYIDGLCPELDVDNGYKAIVAGAATQVGSLFFFNRSGATGSTGVHEVFPDRVHIGDVTLRGSGSTTSSFTYVRMEAGHWDLDVTNLKIEHGIKPSSAGQTKGISSGAVANTMRATIKLEVQSTDNSDGAFQPVRLDGNTSLSRADLDLDLFAMYVSAAGSNANYLPVAAAVNVTRIRRIVHPFVVSGAVTSPYPTRPKPVKKVSANYTATHDDEVLVLDASNATGPFTITLPQTSGGSATASPRPGDGSAIQLIFIGDTTTNRITIQPTAGEKLLGTTNGTVVISQAGSGRRDYIGTAADGWW